MDEPWLNDLVIARRHHPTRRRRLDTLLRNGRLRTVLPGVYTHCDREDTFELRLAAAAAWAPTATITGAAAAKALWWPELGCEVITLAGRTTTAPRTWLAMSKASLSSDATGFINEVRFASPAVSCLQLIPAVGAGAIDEALRRGACTLGALQEAVALLRHRPGNVLAARLVLESRDEPWSALERAAHRLLRTSGLTGWKTNYRVVLSGTTYYLDVVFPGAKVVIELDGWEFHKDRTSFERDRVRRNLLTLAGWQILHITWDTLPTMVAQVRRLLPLT